MAYHNSYPNHFGTKLIVLHFEHRIYWLIPGLYFTLIEQFPQLNTLFIRFSYSADAEALLSSLLFSILFTVPHE
jgi:hypothetical protein